MTKAQDETWPYFDDVNPTREDKLRQIIAELALFRNLGLQLVRVDKDYSKIRVPHSEDVVRPGGVIHGGVHAVLIDTAVGHAILSTIKRGFFIATIQMQTKYFAPVTSGGLTCEGKVIRKGRTVAHGDAFLYNDEGALVGQGSCVYAVTRRPV